MNDFNQPGASIPILQVSSHWLSRVANYLCDVVDQAVLIHLRVPPDPGVPFTLRCI